MPPVFVLLPAVGPAQLAVGLTELRIGGVGTVVACGSLLQLAGLPGPAAVVLIGGMFAVGVRGARALARGRP